jgi:tRNA A37 threonylcarbamoyladenosine dehydratase
MPDAFSRTERLLGGEAMEKLSSAHVAVFGLGGVGSFAAEALARSGVGALTIVDDDAVCLTNINRQLIALHSTIGKPKVEVMRARLLDINPNIIIDERRCFVDKSTADEFNFPTFSYIVDAVDTVTAKLLLVEQARAVGVPIISCLGMGNKLDPTRIETADLSQTAICPLARVMRHELKKLGIIHLKVVYSREPPLPPIETERTSCKARCVCPPESRRNCAMRRQVPGSVAWVPSAAGFIIAAEVIKDIVQPTSTLVPLPAPERSALGK